MNRHKAYWPLDEAPGWDGDTGFSGVNARLDPDQLSDGEVADANNTLGLKIGWNGASYRLGFTNISGLSVLYLQ